jgi:hypothetical protein
VDILIDFVIDHLDEFVSGFHILVFLLFLVSNTKIQQLFESTKFFYIFYKKKSTDFWVSGFRKSQSSIYTLVII